MRAKHAGLFVISLAMLSTPAFAQVTPEEAAQRLREKQAARAAQRDKVVQISQGELDDLRAHLAQLEATVQQLRAQVSSASAAASPAKVAPIRAIAVGDSKDQVMDFLRRHPKDYEVLADTVSTPKLTSRTIVKSTQQVQLMPGQTTPPPGAQAGATADREISTEEGAKTETLVLMRKVWKEVPTGATHNSYNGVTNTTIIETERRYVPTEKMTVSITDGAVTSIDRVMMDPLGR